MFWLQAAGCDFSEADFPTICPWKMNHPWVEAYLGVAREKKHLRSGEAAQNLLTVGSANNMFMRAYIGHTLGELAEPSTKSVLAWPQGGLCNPWHVIEQCQLAQKQPHTQTEQNRKSKNHEQHAKRALTPPTMLVLKTYWGDLGKWILRDLVQKQRKEEVKNPNFNKEAEQSQPRQSGK